MYRLADLFIPASAVKLGDNHRRPGAQTGEKAHQQVNQGAGCAAHGGQGLLAHKVPHNHRVHRVVKLLEKGAQQDGEKENQELLPDNALCNAVYTGPCA